MITYPSAWLTSHRTVVLRDASKGPVLIQYMTTRRKVVAEYVIMPKEQYDELVREEAET